MKKKEMRSFRREWRRCELETVFEMWRCGVRNVLEVNREYNRAQKR